MSSGADQGGNEVDRAADSIADGKPETAIGKKVERLYALVPEIGTRWRWYDIPYRLLHWLLTSWRRKVIPWRLRLLLNRGLNFFIPFNQYERTKAEPLDDPMNNLVLPPAESVRQGGIWTVELFPPSHYDVLTRALRRSGWDSHYHVTSGGTNEERVRRAREARGFSWSRIGLVARPDTKFLIPDAKRENLAAEFEYVELHAVQIGTSLTAVVAHFRLTDVGETSLDEVWHTTHEPKLDWRGLHRPHVKNRYFAAISATQTERQRLHDLARRWPTERCGGFFAGTDDGQPVVDLNLFDQFDPMTQEPDRPMRDSLRALGMQGDYIHNYMSDEMPGAILRPVLSRLSDSETLRNCWGIVGRNETLVELNDLPGYGEKPFSPSTLGAMFDDAVRAFLLHVAAIRYLDELRAQYSRARDLAKTRHGRFSARRTRQLRDELLTTSLDLPNVARDTEELWSAGWRQWSGIGVTAKPAPGTPERFHTEYDLIEHLGEVRASGFEELTADDNSYRTVLATVASLGSSVDATKMSRLALLVALVSLLVAIALLLFTEPGESSLWSHLVDWLK